MNQNQLSVETILGFFGQVKSDASIAVVTDPNTGKKYAVKSTTDYAAGYLTDLQNGEVLLASNKPQVGLRSMNGNQLLEGKYQVVYGVRNLFDTTLVANSEAALIAAPFASVAPVQFKNGEYRMSQTGELIRLSGTDATNFKASTGNDADFRNIVPVVIRPMTDVSINFKLAGAATAFHAYKTEWRAVEFVLIGKQ